MPSSITYPGNIILTGFMGTGKSVVGKKVAKRLSRNFLDTDAIIEQGAGKSVASIFSEDGEQCFRGYEKEVCRELSETRGFIIATGGGMLLDPENRKLLSRSGVIVRLDASIPTILHRTQRNQQRPLLNCEDSEQRIRSLLAERSAAYASLPFHVDTTGMELEETANRILGIIQDLDDSSQFVPVKTRDRGGYTIALGPEMLRTAGTMLRDRGISSKCMVVTDDVVANKYLQVLLASLKASGFNPQACIIRSGESSKNLSEVQKLYEAFLKYGLDRNGAVIALGGGVVGDLAGFAAATYMRGVHLVQCPTTLLAMVDSSVGGKTGVDLPQGKNLVGAFKQPLITIADTSCLETLPHKEFLMGMAESIKHAIISDPELFEHFEKTNPNDLTIESIAQSIQVKVDVVEQDPFESGLRETLNLGHTVGHAIEKCSNYSLLHGEAVSIGLVAAARLSSETGLCEQTIPQRIEAMLDRVGLPVRHTMDPHELVAAMTSDKKTRDGQIRFILIQTIGKAQFGCSVPSDVLLQVLSGLRVSDKKTRSEKRGS
jgi:3-dehydroquinate synthase